MLARNVQARNKKKMSKIGGRREREKLGKEHGRIAFLSHSK